MGTDIFLYAEHRVNGRWTPVPEPAVTPWSDRKIVPLCPFDIGRAYELFSVLAGHSIGMRSARTQVPAISTPRGFPKDLSDFYRKRFVRKSKPGNSDTEVSWLVVQELVNFDWDQPVLESAFVEPEFVGLFDDASPFPNSFPDDAKLYH